MSLGYQNEASVALRALELKCMVTSFNLYVYPTYDFGNPYHCKVSVAKLNIYWRLSLYFILKVSGNDQIQSKSLSSAFNRCL